MAWQPWLVTRLLVHLSATCRVLPRDGHPLFYFLGSNCSTLLLTRISPIALLRLLLLNTSPSTSSLYIYSHIHA
ncbi:hypothetical protein BCR37DRAFT_379263 [Protomyces lactucae-debilis]|uniref:Uncharacterized protein n=1 Tax=Protomyces lactucae-debilis TaxID=2754530 RepID=A0A1Y2FH20_PROLT|nr:uncharacterized protein BCR37DRAFT_379263 [Protomyces lactucae-debilis]ORY83248.1 hypothetical protein BCR37DRAFT_379263 [Protomyces lactucae-debilis]